MLEGIAIVAIAGLMLGAVLIALAGQRKRHRRKNLLPRGWHCALRLKRKTSRKARGVTLRQRKKR